MGDATIDRLSRSLASTPDRRKAVSLLSAALSTVWLATSSPEPVAGKKKKKKKKQSKSKGTTTPAPTPTSTTTPRPGCAGNSASCSSDGDCCGSWVCRRQGQCCTRSGELAPSTQPLCCDPADDLVQGRCCRAVGDSCEDSTFCCGGTSCVDGACCSGLRATCQIGVDTCCLGLNCDKVRNGSGDYIGVRCCNPVGHGQCTSHTDCCDGYCVGGTCRQCHPTATECPRTNGQMSCCAEGWTCCGDGACARPGGACCDDGPCDGACSVAGTCSV